MRIRWNKEENRFETEDGIAYLTYELRYGNVLNFVEMNVPYSHHRFEKALLEDAMKQAGGANYTVTSDIGAIYDTDHGEFMGR